MVAKTKVYSKLMMAMENRGSGIIVAVDEQVDERKFKKYQVHKDYKEIIINMKSRLPTHYYEVILAGEKCNFAIDLDIEDTFGRENPIERVNYIVEVVTNAMKDYIKTAMEIEGIETKAIILESPATEKKESYHIIFRVTCGDKNVYFQDNSTNCRNFYEYIKINKGIEMLGVDKSMYIKNKLFRMMGSSKIEYPDNLLTLIEPQSINPLETLCSYIEDKPNNIVINKTVSISKTKKEKKVVEKVDYKNQNTIEELLMCVNTPKNYDEWHKLGILLYCVFEGNNEGLELFKKYGKTKAPEHYDEAVYKKSWDGYNTLEECRYSIGTLYYLAKRDNLERYEQIISSELYETDMLKGTHVGVAEAMKKRFNNKLMYIEDTNNGKWMTYDDSVGIWKESTKSNKDISQCFYQMTRELKAKEYDSETKKIMRDNLIAKLENSTFKSQVKTEMAAFFCKTSMLMNRNPDILPFTNGVYDFKTKSFRKGEYDEFIVETTGYNYKKESSEYAKEFIKDIIPNEEVREYVLKTTAKYMVNRHHDEEIFVWYNIRGSNGKTTLIKALSSVFGNFSYTVKPDFLYENQNVNSEGATPALMGMKGKRFISYSEPKVQKKLEASVIKSLTGGDILSGRQLYGAAENFTINGCQVICCNERLEMTSYDGGIIRRLRMIYFETEFVEKPEQPYQREIKKYDVEKLKYSMLNLLIENHTYDKIDIPKCILLDNELYLKESDNIRRFINDYIEEDADGHFSKDELMMIITDKEVIKEYEFYKMRAGKCIEKIMTKLGKEFGRYRIDGSLRRGVIKGYKIKMMGCEIED